MGFGNLDRRIVIQTGTETVTGNGERTTSWATFHTCWAGMEYGTGSEKYEGDQLSALNQTRFKVRYKSGINEKMRISYDSSYYDIMHIEEVDRERYLILTAEKKY